MTKFFALLGGPLLALLLSSNVAYDQTAVSPCVRNALGGCAPVTASNPLPVTGGSPDTSVQAPVAPAAPTATHSVLTGCQYLASPSTWTDTQQGALRCDSDGALVAYAPPLSVSGSITTQNLNMSGTATAGSAVEIPLDGRSTLSVQVTGTWTGTLVMQTTDDGTTWVTTGGAPFQRESTGVYSPTIATGLTDIWSLDSTGHLKARITASAAVTGAATTTLIASAGNARVNIGYQPAVSVPTWAGGALGAMANYGTSPGTVLVPGVNSFVTNTVTVQEAGQTYANIATNANTAVKASPGVFVGLVVNTGGTTSTATVYDDTKSGGGGTTCTGTKIATFDTTAQVALIPYNATATVGICVVTAGVAAADITVLYR